MLEGPAEKQGKRSTRRASHTEPPGDALSTRAGEDTGSSAWAGEYASAFDSFLERFCARLSAAFSKVLNLPVQISVLGLEQLSQAGFQASTQKQGCCYALHAVGSSEAERPGRSAESGTCLEIRPAVAFAIIDRLLGGSQESAFTPGRPMTEIERRLLRRAASLAADSLSCPGQAGGELRFCVGEEITRQDKGTAAAKEEPVLVATFSLTVGRCAGNMRLCFPHRLMRILARSGGGGFAEGAEAAGRLGGPQKAEAPIEISAAVEGTSLTAEELADLGPGDIVSTDAPGGGEVIIRVGGIPKFVGRLSTSNGRRAVIITRRLG